MEESLFHRLMTEQATATLQLQYRMNEPLAALANRIAYDDQLKCANAAVADARLDIDEKVTKFYKSMTVYRRLAMEESLFSVSRVVFEALHDLM